jgi:hypothetical protein
VTGATRPEALPEVLALAQERREARAARDFAAADALRDRIADAGWLVTDTADGFDLAPAPPFRLAANAAALPDRSADSADHRVSALVVVDGWPDDLETCIEALLQHGPADLRIVGLDLGDRDGAGLRLHELAQRHPDRVAELHLATTIGWGPAVTALVRADRAEFQVVLDPSSVLTGDAITPLIAALEQAPDAVAAGWRGVTVDLADDWRSFTDAEPGEVDALLGYLFVVRRVAATATPPSPKARFYRNADMEWSLLLREAGGRLLQPLPAADLPVRQDRHRGYHDSDPAYRDTESKRTYDRLLQRFRGRTDLLAPR